MRLFSYVVASDSGFSPNPYHGFCTLACCKPAIRRTAKVGDWIAGLTPGSKAKRLSYAMKVSEVLTVAQYWNDERFQAKKPTFDGLPENRLGDNIYEPLVKGGYRQHKSMHSRKSGKCGPDGKKACLCRENTETKKRDLSGWNVLIATEFVYYGNQKAHPLPESLRAVMTVGRSHKCKFDDGMLAEWNDWITARLDEVRGSVSGRR
ncbi:MAG: hypothetical protein LUE17_05340 [Planctomycetaceae bacterium]|nr:hypothetical protein [Planctomycetaceae bacterium]